MSQAQTEQVHCCHWIEGIRTHLLMSMVVTCFTIGVVVPPAYRIFLLKSIGDQHQTVSTPCTKTAGFSFLLMARRCCSGAFGWLLHVPDCLRKAQRILRQVRRSCSCSHELPTGVAALMQLHLRMRVILCGSFHCCGRSSCLLQQRHRQALSNLNLTWVVLQMSRHSSSFAWGGS